MTEDQSSTTELALNSPPTQIRLSKSISVSTPTLNTIVSRYSQSLFVPSMTAKYSNVYSPEAVNSYDTFNESISVSIAKVELDESISQL